MIRNAPYDEVFDLSSTEKDARNLFDCLQKYEKICNYTTARSTLQKNYEEGDDFRLRIINKILQKIQSLCLFIAQIVCLIFFCFWR